MTVATPVRTGVTDELLAVKSAAQRQADMLEHYQQPVISRWSRWETKTACAIATPWA
ncbi:MAG: hypothetical protein ACLR9P_00735 [Escherichia coli]